MADVARMPKDIFMDGDQIAAAFAADGIYLVAGSRKSRQQELADDAGRAGDNNAVG